MKPFPTPITPNSDTVNGSRLDRLLRFVRGNRRRIVEGLALGALVGLCASLLGFNDLLHLSIFRDIVFIPAVGGALLSISRCRILIRLAAICMFAALVMVGYTPLINSLIAGYPGPDTLKHAAAIVVLSSASHKDQTLDSDAQSRAVHGFLLLKQGWADTLVLTRNIPAIGDESSTVIHQMHGLGLNYPVELVGPVATTHDEAVVTARLAKTHNWQHVILVTQPWHMPRAAAVFRKAGVTVICSPCVEGAYDLSDLRGPRGRLAAFKDWLHEFVGFETYRLRGWL